MASHSIRLGGGGGGGGGGMSLLRSVWPVCVGVEGGISQHQVEGGGGGG